MSYGTVRSLVVVSTLLAALSVGSAASAQDTSQDRAALVQKLSEDGSALYQARDYRGASEKFLQAYGMDPDPNLLYNIGKCYEALDQKQAAIDKYEQFINAPGGDASAKLKAQDAVRVLKASSVQGPGVQSDQTSERASSSGGHMNLPAIVSFGVGAAGLVVGSIFGIVSVSKGSSLSSTCTDRHCPPDSKSDITSLKTTSTISTIGFVVGGVGAAAGVAFLFLFKSGGSSEKSASASLLPYVGPGSAGVSGTF